MSDKHRGRRRGGKRQQRRKPTPSRSVRPDRWVTFGCCLWVARDLGMPVDEVRTYIAQAIADGWLTPLGGFAECGCCPRTQLTIPEAAA